MLQRIKKCYRENSCLNIKTWLHNSPADTLYEHLYCKKLSLINKFIFYSIFLEIYL